MKGAVIFIGALLATVVSSADLIGKTTRYWDCCKSSCAWSGKAKVNKPVDTCAANGVLVIDKDTANACDGGSGYACNDNQPWKVNKTLSYGFAAAVITGKTELNTCCACYQLTFTSGPVAKKQMIVQVINTGADLGENHFDLQIPGGGVGIFNGCQSQWGAPADGWGVRYGGVSSVGECDQLPSVLRSGCKWRFGWFENADNPKMKFHKVTCPTAITSKTNCRRN